MLFDGPAFGAASLLLFSPFVMLAFFSVDSGFASLELGFVLLAGLEGEAKIEAIFGSVFSFFAGGDGSERST